MAKLRYLTNAFCYDRIIVLLITIIMNALKQYKEESGLSWRTIEDTSGISITTLIKVASYDLPTILKQTTLGTYKTLRDTIKVDLLK
jgi:hypothetical protein